MTEQQAISEWQRQSGRAEALGFELVMTGLGFQLDGQTLGSLVAVKAYLNGVAKERNRQFKNQAHASFDRPLRPFMARWDGRDAPFVIDALDEQEATALLFDHNGGMCPQRFTIEPLMARHYEKEAFHG